MDISHIKPQLFSTVELYNSSEYLEILQGPGSHFEKYVTGIIFCMRPANDRCHYIAMPSLIGWVHTQNDPCHMFFNQQQYIWNSSTLRLRKKWLPLCWRHTEIHFLEKQLLYLTKILPIFPRSLFYKKSQHWFRWWLEAEQATSHYLKQWWSSLSICRWASMC